MRVASQRFLLKRFRADFTTSSRTTTSLATLSLHAMLPMPRLPAVAALLVPWGMAPLQLLTLLVVMLLLLQPLPRQLGKLRVPTCTGSLQVRPIRTHAFPWLDLGIQSPLRSPRLATTLPIQALPCGMPASLGFKPLPIVVVLLSDQRSKLKHLSRGTVHVIHGIPSEGKRKVRGGPLEPG